MYLLSYTLLTVCTVYIILVKPVIIIYELSIYLLPSLILVLDIIIGTYMMTLW